MSVCLGDAAQPLLWTDLRHPENSDTEKLKGHGFDLESSRLRDGGKAERLLAVLSLAFAWCYAVGYWSVGAVKPIRLIGVSAGRRGACLGVAWT